MALPSVWTASLSAKPVSRWSPMAMILGGNMPSSVAHSIPTVPVPAFLLVPMPSSAEHALFPWRPISAFTLLHPGKAMIGVWCTTNELHLNAAISVSNSITSSKPVNITLLSSGMFASTWLWCWFIWPAGTFQNSSLRQPDSFAGGGSACLLYLSFHYPVSNAFFLVSLQSFLRIMQLMRCYSECTSMIKSKSVQQGRLSIKCTPCQVQNEFLGLTSAGYFHIVWLLYRHGG